jgi:hypothetical protein
MTGILRSRGTFRQPRKVAQGCFVVLGDQNSLLVFDEAAWSWELEGGIRREANQ